MALALAYSKWLLALGYLPCATAHRRKQLYRVGISHTHVAQHKSRDAIHDHDRDLPMWYFQVAQYLDQESWLRQMHLNPRTLLRIVPTQMPLKM